MGLCRSLSEKMRTSKTCGKQVSAYDMIADDDCEKNNKKKVGVVSPGCLPIYAVGRGGGKEGYCKTRYVIPVAYLSSARFRALFHQYENEMSDAARDQPIALPISPQEFEAVISLVKAEMTTKKKKGIKSVMSHIKNRLRIIV